MKLEKHNKITLKLKKKNVKIQLKHFTKKKKKNYDRISMTLK